MAATSDFGLAFPAHRIRGRLALAVLLLTALLIASPTLIRGVGPSDSVVYNSVWTSEFIAALRRGDLPPRWLPGAFQGLGAPSFYYYPPLAFYVASLVDFLTAHRLDTPHVIAWACFVLSLASGGGMFAWLRGRTGDRWALIAGVAYMLAPYHTIDFYVRGAFAEIAATAVLPWVAWGLERAATSWRGIPALALAYAALALSHLPSALLFTLIAVPAVVGWRVWTAAPGDRIAVAGRCLAGGVLGLGLAASYLGPALLMQDAAEIEWLWANDAASWGLLAHDRWPSPAFMQTVSLASCAAGTAGLSVLLATFDAPRRQVATAAMVFGAIAVLATILHATPWVWDIKLLAQVQFSYRIIVVSEFAAVAAVGLAAASGRPRRLAALLVVPALLAAGSMGLSAPKLRNVVIYPVDPGSIALIAAGRAPNEHLPTGYATYYPEFTDPNLLSGFPEIPLVSVAGGKVIAASGFPDGSVAMDIDAPSAAQVVVKRFYFPSWRAERVDGRKKTKLNAAAYGPWRLVSFEVPVGRGVYRIRQTTTPVARASDAVALIALLALVGLAAAALRRKGSKMRKPPIGTR